MKTGKTYWDRILWLALILSGIWGCAGYEAARNDAVDPPAPFADGLPGLPPDDASLKAPSETDFLSAMGKDAWLSSAGASVEGDNLVLTAGTGGLEYAVYRFETGLPGTATYDVSAVFTIGGDNELWLGLSDYASGRWSIRGPYVNDVEILLDDSIYLSPAGTFHLAVIVHDGKMAAVNTLAFSFDNGVTPPDTTYLGDIRALLEANCTSCHQGASPAAGIGLDSFRAARANSAEVISFVVEGDHRTLPQDDKDLLQSWVDGAAPYGADVTYAADIQPLVMNRCATCHTTSSFGGVNLATYAGAAANAESALAQILAENMPQSGGPLNNDQKDWWQVWVDDGKPE